MSFDQFTQYSTFDTSNKKPKSTLDPTSPLAKSKSIHRKKSTDLEATPLTSVNTHNSLDLTNRNYSTSLSISKDKQNNISTYPDTNKDKVVNEGNNNKKMGAKNHKPWWAIGVDWFVCALLGWLYYTIDHYLQLYASCIPGTDLTKYCQHDPTMESKSPLFAFPYNKEPVPVSYPYLIGALHWLVVIFVSIMILKPSLRDMCKIFFKMEALLREVIMALLVCQIGVGVMKRFVGRPRPNYYEYVGIDPHDAIESYVSGHASSSFCIHMMLIYHLLTSMHWASNDKLPIDVTHFNTNSLFLPKLFRITRHLSSFNVVFISSFLIVPIWISCTRLRDYYHHYSDVIGGASMGVLTSFLVFLCFRYELRGKKYKVNNSLSEPLVQSTGFD